MASLTSLLEGWRSGAALWCLRPVEGSLPVFQVPQKAGEEVISVLCPYVVQAIAHFAAMQEKMTHAVSAEGCSM